MFHLRDYQSDLIERTRDVLRVHHSVLIQSPTGSGKTALAAYMIGTAAQRGRTAWFVCHRDFLLRQTSHAFTEQGIPHGFIAAGQPQTGHAVKVVSIGTAVRRLARLSSPDLIVWDESHHLGAHSWESVYRWAGPSCHHVGLTATPQRLDGRGLDGFFAGMVDGPSVRWLISQGYLSRYRAYAPSAPDLRGIHIRAGDYATDELAGVMDTSQIIGDIVGHYRRIAAGKRAIYYAVSVEHSQHLAASFNAAGVAARHLDAGSSTMERMVAAADIARGSLMVLTNVDLFGEGYDLSAQAGAEVSIETVGLCRPTQSLTLHLQQIGRALRPKPTPALILDHAGNIARHGLPDQEREWNLEGRAKGERRVDPAGAVKQCPVCFYVHALGPRVCPECGHVYEIAPRQVIEVAGELTEINATVLRYRRRTEQARAETLEDLIRVGRERGYRDGWARHVWAARRQRRA